MTFLLWEGSNEPLNCWLPPLIWPCSHRWHFKGVAVAHISLSLMGFGDIWTVPSWFIFQPVSLITVLNQIHQTEFFCTIKVGEGRRKKSTFFFQSHVAKVVALFSLAQILMAKILPNVYRLLQPDTGNVSILVLWKIKSTTVLTDLRRREQVKVWKSPMLFPHCVTNLTEDRVLTAFLLSPIMRSVTLFQVAFAWSSGAALAEPKHKESGQNRWMCSSDSHITLCYFCSGFSPPWRWGVAVRVVFDNTFSKSGGLQKMRKAQIGWVPRQHDCLWLGIIQFTAGTRRSKWKRNNGKAAKKGSLEGTIKLGRLKWTQWGSLSLLNDVCKDVSPFYRLHISLLPLSLHSLFLALSVVSVALRCWSNEN